MSEKQSREYKTLPNALTLIDGIIGAQRRDGPTQGVLVVVDSNEPFHSLMEGFGVLVGATKTTNGWKIPGESAFEAAYFTRSYLEALYDFDSRFMNLPLADQLSLFNKTRNWSESSFISYAKYATAWPMARWMRYADRENDLPEKPDGFEGSPLLFSGSARKFIKNRLISHQKKTVRLPWTILQGVKRAAAPAPDSYVHKTMLKHRSILTKVPENNWATRAEYDQFMVEAFKGFASKGPKLFEATTSASYESKRSTGGARQYLREELGARVFGSDHLTGHDDDLLLEVVETRPGQLSEVRGIPTPKWDFVRSKALEESKAGPLKIMVSAVLEPLKVRLISKGQSWSYYFSRFYQKELWSHLQTFPQFVLTGRPMDSSDLYEILRQEEKCELNLKKGKWVSGDYSAATDNLSATFTRDAFETSLLSSGLDWDSMEVLRSVIYNQELHYPHDMVKKGGLDPIMQSNGQLMGSTLSFPILCIVNLVAYAKSVQEYTGRHIPLRKLPVKINGDDILFRADDELYGIWKRNVKIAGFDLSVGKNYIHPTLLTVNSELYSMTEERNGMRVFKKIEFFNIGLMTGQSKITGREQGLRATPVWDNFNQVVEGACNKARAFKRFIHYNLSTIKLATKNGDFNLFLPFERGGLGFNQDPSILFKITSFQRRLATVLEKEYRDKVSRGEQPRPFLGTYAQTEVTGTKLHHVPVLKLVPRIGPVEQEHSAYVPPEKKFPNLSVVGDIDHDYLSFKLPNKEDKSLRQVRTNTDNRMGDKEILQWPYRVVEIPYTRDSPVVATVENIPMWDLME